MAILDRLRALAIACLSILLVSVATGAMTPTSGVPRRVGAKDLVVASKPIRGTRCEAFPANNYWHADIRGLPVHAQSSQWLANMEPDSNLHPDFGPSASGRPAFGIPITVVGRRQPTRRVRFTFARESDRVKYPVGKDTKIEGGRKSDGDRHAIIIQRNSCRLYELFDLRKRKQTWRAGSGAVWSLKSNALRPDGLTSADAAGLPILPGLLRYDEVRRGAVDHAIRFTTDVTSKAHVWPARHDAGSTTDPAFPPMGARFRLRSSFVPRGFTRGARAVVRAMKVYGLVLADNGSPWFFQGERDRRWTNRLLDELKSIPASAFVAVDTTELQVDEDSAATP